MAKTITVTGKVDIKVDVGDGLEDLGESIDMSQVREQAFWHNVPGDKNGGPQGPPIEVQFLGSIAIVTFELSKWDPAVVDKLRKRAVNAVLGTIADTEVGTLMLEDNGIRLLLDSPTRPINFPCALVREPIAYAMGTKFQSMNFGFECHRAPAGTYVDILFNTDDT